MTTYQLIRQKTYDDFNRAVNNFLKDGWDLYGETKIQSEVENNVQVTYYYQVMVKD